MHSFIRNTVLIASQKSILDHLRPQTKFRFKATALSAEAKK